MGLATAILLWVSGAMLAATAVLCLWRVITGPSILDRMIASDVILTTLMLVIGAEMAINSHTRTVPLMVILAATAIFGTVAVSRFVTRPAEPSEAPGVTGAEGA
ncbi:monovalent cation/H+ antiporter complex subunit F [Microcella alkaliphila]|jgi:multicomponent Na+:H+ antiporter subunit F|uniref:Putative Na(+)/H(+) antiporter subunit n=1 Tax=Microcella alkaliphila TaxID=279828 RepID=A0A0U5BQA1_9MICO|nr:monovalent cation/H+ antiporter complex subunit F [Microcella alkaliphila]BAU33051.1 putative Na(+)/H(+) antiporter subunit [Microcella alkaliphila]